jgi:hypothetical protein
VVEYLRLVHILGVPDPIQKYAGNKLLESPSSPSYQRSLTNEEKRNYLQAVEEVRKLYKKPQEFSPVPATLQTKWQARQSKSSLGKTPWPLHNLRLAHQLDYIQDGQPISQACTWQLVKQ